MVRVAMLKLLVEIEEKLVQAQSEGVINDDGTSKGLAKAFQIINERFNEILEGE